MDGVISANHKKYALTNDSRIQALTFELVSLLCIPLKAKVGKRVCFMCD